MDHLNYHHLRYFHAVAHDGTLTGAAHKLNLSQSALSMQIRQLEDRLGHALFERVGRRLELTEIGRITLDHADRIFDTGQELLAVLRQSGRITPPLRIGALSTLSRNFQMKFLAPALDQPDLEIILRSGDEDELLIALNALMLDVVLTNAPPRSGVAGDVVAHRLAEQPVALHGTSEKIKANSLADLLARETIILPSEATIRTAVLGIYENLGLTPRITAQVDDMAMVRLLARAGAGLAIAPSVVVADELAAGRLHTAPFDLNIQEPFYAVAARRAFQHPLLNDLLSAARQ
jgi:LysR family transcriptional activator of nhaA